MTVRRQTGRVGVALLCAVGGVVGCTVTTDDGGARSSTSEEDVVVGVWDLRGGHGIDRVGWPDANGSDVLLIERASELVVELPGNVSIDVTDLLDGPARVTASRATVDGFDESLVRQIRIESPRGEVDDIGVLAEELAERYGLDGSQFGPWRRRNPTFGGPDGEAGTRAAELGPDGPSLSLGTRMRSGDVAVVAFTLVWPTYRADGTRVT